MTARERRAVGSLRAGAAAARRSLGLVLLLAGVDLFLALAVVGPLAGAFSSAITGTTAAARLVTGIDVPTILEVVAALRPRAAALLPGVALAVLGALVVSSVSLAAAHEAAQGESSLAEQLRGAARHAGAYLRTTLLATPAYLAVGALVAFGGGALWRRGEAGGPGGIALRATVALAAAALALLLATWTSHARAERYLRRETGALRALGRAARFVLWRRPLRALGVAGAGAGAWLAAGLAYTLVAWWIPGHGWGLVALLFVMRQLLVMTRVSVKVAWGAAELRLYEAETTEETDA